MKCVLVSRLACLAVLLVPALCLASPDPTPDSGADVVFLRSNCNVNGSPKENCFESMTALSDVSTGWIWNTRNPSASSPLLVEIGPGEFGPFNCDGGGYVTLRGAGREQTILADEESGVEVHNCDDLSFIDLGVSGDHFGVFWVGGGTSSWSNTDIVNFGESNVYARVGWYDVCDGSQYPNFERSLHYFHGSRVRVRGAESDGETRAFSSQCGENWFLGGEIVADFAGAGSKSAVIHTFQILPGFFGDVRIFGTTVRGRVVAGSGSLQLTGVEVSTGGIFHAHGSIVNVSAQGASGNTNVVGLSSAGFAHTPGTAWVLTPSGSGTATRVETSGSGVALSPFLWQSGSAPPAITSQHGSDLFVETDCNASGCSGGSDPHMLIYSSNCTGVGGPWFDVVRQSCRN